MTKLTKVNIIPRGGIAIVCNTAMESVAREAKNQLSKLGVDSISFQKLKIKRFACGEVRPHLPETVRGKSVFLFFGFNRQKYNADLMTLFLSLNTLDNAGCSDITLVAPFFPYTRQDRKDGPRTPLSAAKIIQMLATSKNLIRVITLDLHAEQLESSLAVANLEFDHLPGSLLVAKWVRKHISSFDDLVVVAPDNGSAKRAKKLAGLIAHGTPIAIFDKERDKDGTKTGDIIGASVHGKTCLLNDDMIDTGGTIADAAKALILLGAKQVIISATHPVFSPKNGTSAYSKLEKSGAQVLVTNSLKTKSHPWLEAMSIGELMGNTIFANITFDGSVSKIINGDTK